MYTRVLSLYSEEIETDICATCHILNTSRARVEKLKKLCYLVDVIFSLFRPFGPILGKNCFSKRATHLQVREQKGENWDGTDFLTWGSVQVIQSTMNGLYMLGILNTKEIIQFDQK